MIWITGANGMLGSELSGKLRETGFDFVSSDREVDITDGSAVSDFVCGKEINWIVNCAAYTNVEQAETDVEKCDKLNVRGPEVLSHAAKTLGAKLIHISTDYVFNGEGARPYKETDATDPIGVYGRSKRDGEQKILAVHSASYIIRTAWLYGRYGKNFVTTMIRLMGANNTVKVVDDQRGSPTWTCSLVSVIIKLIEAVERGEGIPFGIYNFTNEGQCVWFEFAQEIYTKARALSILQKDCTVLPCTSAEFGAKVKRPQYSVLDKTKIKAALDITIPDWKGALEKFLIQIK